MALLMIFSASQPVTVSCFHVKFCKSMDSHLKPLLVLRNHKDGAQVSKGGGKRGVMNHFTFGHLLDSFRLEEAPSSAQPRWTFIIHLKQVPIQNYSCHRPDAFDHAAGISTPFHSHSQSEVLNGDSCPFSELLLSNRILKIKFTP